jgi:hypothetical protein
MFLCKELLFPMVFASEGVAANKNPIRWTFFVCCASAAMESASTNSSVRKNLMWLTFRGKPPHL